jgi:predicted esterase
MAEWLHANEATRTRGASLRAASVAVLLFHGRGGTAETILEMANQFDHDSVAYRAPQAARDRWFPESWLAPREHNEPWLSSALERVEDEIATVRRHGISLDRIVLVGFAEGACVLTEAIARTGCPCGGVVALSGGLPGQRVDIEIDEESLDGTPVYLSCRERDPQVPVRRMHETAAVFEAMDGAVTERVSAGMAHDVTAADRAVVAEMIADLLTE